MGPEVAGEAAAEPMPPTTQMGPEGGSGDVGNGSPSGTTTQQAASDYADASPRPPRDGDPRTVAVMDTPSGNRYYGRSGSGSPNHPVVQAALDDVPEAQQSAYHGECAEIHCMNQAA